MPRRHLLDRQLQDLEDAGAVGQPGEGVAPGGFPQAVLELHGCGDVACVEHDPGDDRVVEQVRGPQLDPGVLLARPHEPELALHRRPGVLDAVGVQVEGLAELLRVYDA